MKKLTLTLIFLIIFVTYLVPAGAKEEFFAPVTLTVNEKYVNTKNHPYLTSGVTMVSIRDIGEIFSCDVFWDENTDTATLSSGSTKISVTKNKKTAKVNGKNVSLIKSATIVNDRIYVPMRFISETFGAGVTWNADTLTANIRSGSATVPIHLSGKAPFSSDELMWLSRIVSAESSGETNRGKVAVANVILNRVESPEFPDTIYGVIFDNKYGVQFTPTMDGSIYNTPTTDSKIAAKRALLGENVSKNCLYFLNPRIATNFWIVNNRKFYQTIGNHDFYL